jgi:hypothetical protein
MELESNDALVELDLAFQVGDGQVHMPHACAGVYHEFCFSHRSNFRREFRRISELNSISKSRCERGIGRLPGGGESICAGSKHKISFRKAINAVGPNRDAGLPPTQAEVRVVIYRLRKLADPVYEVKRRLEVFKFVLFFEVPTVDHFPVGAEFFMKAL